MAAIYKKDRQGAILVRVAEGPPFIQIAKGFRMNGDFRMNIVHFINPESAQAIWLMSGLKTSLLCNNEEDDDDTFRCSSAREGLPVMVQYEKPIMLYCPNFRDEIIIHLLHLNGRVMSGSNIYNSSFGRKNFSLCLGQTPNPFNFNPVELLLFNRANRDLAWQGQPLEGEWKTLPNREKIFHVETWTSYHQLINPADELQDVIDALSNI